MIPRLLFFFKNYLFWIGYFECCRLVFLFSHFEFAQDLTLKELATPFLLGLRMDASMGGYWMILTGLVMAVGHFLSVRIFMKSHRIVTLLLLLICTTIVVADIELYTHWNFRINSTPLFYLSREGLNSIPLIAWAWLLFIYTTIMVAALFTYHRFISRPALKFQPVSRWYFLVWIVLAGLMFFPIRGRLTVAPMNTGVVYFHHDRLFPNHLGINPVWTFFESTLSDDNVQYPKDLYKKGDLDKAFTKLMAHKGQPPKYLNTAQPNIIIIMLESFTSKVIASLGGKEGVAPSFDKWAKKGMLFNQFYASGDRTVEGLASILSGYPAQPLASIVKYPEKTQHLSFLPKKLNEIGYASKFYYGGDIGFANMESYITLAGYEIISGNDQFPATAHQSKWGVADEYAFDRLLSGCNSAKSPFFHTLLTLSSHEPFDVPMETVYSGSDINQFYNACLYTDKCLDRFLTEASSQPWWKNTWVIITADHGSRFPDKRELKDKGRFAIPMLWLGGALNTQDSVVTTISNQTDIAATILGQLGEENNFTFSRDIFTAATPFSIFTFNNGYSYLGPNSTSTYDFDIDRFIYLKGKRDERLDGMVYMQKLFDDYNSLQ